MNFDSRPLGVGAVADVLGFDKTAIYLAIKQGHLRAFKLRGRWLIFPEDLTLWIQAGENRTLDEAQGVPSGPGAAEGSSRPASASPRASAERPSFRDLAKRRAA